MSSNNSFTKNINFTPIPITSIQNSKDKNLFNKNTFLNCPNPYNRSDNYISSNYNQIYKSNFAGHIRNTNNINSYFENNNENSNENNNIYNSCYILISKFDNCSKKMLVDFISQQKIDSRDIKMIGNDKIILKFQNQIYRNKFINEYNKVRDNFFGIEIKFIDEKERDIIFNNNANKTSHKISYNYNFVNYENNIMNYQQNKSNFQKFLDVFLNL